MCMYVCVRSITDRVNVKVGFEAYPEILLWRGKRGVEVAPSLCLSLEREGERGAFEIMKWTAFDTFFVKRLNLPRQEGGSDHDSSSLSDSFQPPAFPVENLPLDGGRLYLSLSVKILLVRRRIQCVYTISFIFHFISFHALLVSLALFEKVDYQKSGARERECNIEIFSIYQQRSNFHFEYFQRSKEKAPVEKFM